MYILYCVYFYIGTALVLIYHIVLLLISFEIYIRDIALHIICIYILYYVLYFITL